MKLSAFEELFTEKNPDGAVWPGSTFGRPGTVAVRFSTDGKIYHYRGTVLEVAEKMNLIPAIDVMDEAEEASMMLVGGHTKVLVHIECWDTVRHMLNEHGIHNELKSEVAKPDNYGRPQEWLSLGEIPEWAK